MSAGAGFTLVELMVTVLVVSILASIAVPTYTAQVRKSRRTEARTALLDLAGREERYFSTNNKYSSTSTDVGYSDFTTPIGSGYYTIKVELNKFAAGDFLLTATPVTGKGQDKDTKCQSFTVANTGAQAAKDKSSADSTADCWG